MNHLLSDYLKIVLRHRWFIMIFTAIVLATVAFQSFSTVPVYRATALVLIEKEQPNYYSSSREAVMVESSQLDYYQTQYKILQSRALVQSTLKELSTNQAPELLGADRVDWFLKSLTIDPLVNTRLVKVHFESTNPALAAEAANALADRYVLQNQENRLFISKDILETLEPGRPSRNRPRSISLPDYESLPSVVNNKLIQELKTEYARAEAQRAELLERYTIQHPSMKRLSSQMTQMRSRIDTEVRKIAQAVKAELSGQMQGNNIRIIDRAEIPTQPVRPRPGLHMLLGGFFGLIVGVLLAILADRLDVTVKGPEDIQKTLKVPYLGAIPRSSRLQKGFLRRRNPYLLCFDCPSAPEAEAFRNIRTSIVFAGVHEPLSSLLVTSTIAGEGKTAAACNLAVVFTHLGERVLLMDGDLRKPRLHTVLDLPGSSGLSSFLESNGPPEDFVFETVVPGLHAMVAGTPPPNPAELLSSKKLQDFFAWALQAYDRVIVDGPSATSFSDALLLSKCVKNVIWVVQAGKTNALWASHACRRFKDSSGRIVGAIINQEQGKPSRYYYSDNGGSAETIPRRTHLTERGA